MAGLIKFSILCAAVLVAVAQADNLDAEVLFVKDINEFRMANPEAVLTPLVKEENARSQIRYTIGNRVNGDRVLAQGGNNIKYPSAQDVQLTLRYPQSGTGGVVSHVAVLVDQSSNLGQGYVSAGGIGQRTITVIIEAYSTVYFSYTAQIFGL